LTNPPETKDSDEEPKLYFQPIILLPLFED